jgi:hypothetical protein
MSEASISNSQVRASKFHAVRKFFKDQVLVPLFLVIIGIVLFDPVKHWWVGPDSYKIYLVGIDQPEVKKLFRGVQLGAKLPEMRIDGVKVEVSYVPDDRPNPADTADELIRREDTLCIVGHVLSSRTIGALPVYMKADPPVPVFAIKETNPSLLDGVPDCKRRLNCPVLQLSPDDDQQAIDAISFVFTHSSQAAGTTPTSAGTKSLVPKSVLIVQQSDKDNAKYTDYLVSGWIRELENPKDHVAVKVHPVEKIDDPRNSARPFTDILDIIKSNKPDCVLLAADYGLAKDLLNYLDNKLDDADKGFTVVMSDSAVSPQIKNGFGSLKNVFVMYPISSRDYSDPDSIIGRDAAVIIQELINRAGSERPLKIPDTVAYHMRRLLSMHRVPDAREALGNAVLEEAKSSTAIQGTTGSQYTFKYPIGRKDGAFHIWHVAPADGLKDVDYLDASRMTNSAERILVLQRASEERQAPSR